MAHVARQGALLFLCLLGSRIFGGLPGHRGRTLHGRAFSSCSAHAGQHACKRRQFTRLYAEPESELSISAEALLLPVGPVCPFRSEFTGNQVLDSEMKSMTSGAGDMNRKFAAIALDAQMGTAPDPNAVRPLAEQMRETNDLWKVSLARMQYTEDFQGLEYFKLMEAQMKSKGTSLKQVQDLMTWQMDGMLAFCENRPPPPMPAGVTPEIMQQMDGNSPMMGQPPSLTSWPFDRNCKSMQSAVVKGELDELVRDHEQLIKMGANYGSFDAAGKEIFIDQIEAIESRWEIFMKRFELLGELNPQYAKESQEFLAQMGLQPSEFRQLLRDAHETMRADALRAG